MGDEQSDFIMEFIFKDEAKRFGYENVVKYIQSEVEAVRQLLPIYDYLYDANDFELWNYERCRSGLFMCNEFLEELNLVEFVKSFPNVRFYSFVSDKFVAMRAFIIDPNTKEGDFWKHGKPVGYPSYDGIVRGAGDGTVPMLSAEYMDINLNRVNAEHRYLPYLTQSEIAQTLINKKPAALKGPPPYRKVGIFRVGSPVDLLVTSPSGLSYGVGQPGDGEVFYSGTEDPEFIVIPEPEDGEYKIELLSTGEGHFEVEAIILGDDLELSKIYQGEIGLGEKYEFVVNYDSEAETMSELEVIDTRPPQTRLLIQGTKVEEDKYLPGVILSLEAEDESEVEQTDYSINSTENWQTYTQSIVLDRIGEHWVYYRSVDEYGNQEYIKGNLIYVERPEVIVSQTPDEKNDEDEEAEYLESDIIETQGNFNTATLSDGGVLGAQTRKAVETRSLKEFFVSLLVILISILVLVYLRKQKL